MLSVAVTLGLLAAVLSAPVASAAAGDVERVSVATSGAQGDGDSTAPSISHTGDVVAFQSRASTLVGGDGNGGVDVFTRRRAGQHTERVSSVPGVSAGSTRPAVSADGSSVAFESFAPELGAGVFGDIFLRRGGGAIARLTAPTGNGDNVAGFLPSISADGSTVVFESAAQELIADDENGVGDVFAWRGGSITRLSEGFAGAEANSGSEQPAISSDGRFVAFRSGATNLAPGSDDPASWDIFVRALAGGTERVSGGLGGAAANGDSEDPAISGNGEIVAFQSNASNLVAGDGNNRSDIFVHDRNRHVTERVSVASDGTQGTDNAIQPSISADGRFVAFASLDSTLIPGDTNNVVDIFVHDRQSRHHEAGQRAPGLPVRRRCRLLRAGDLRRRVLRRLRARRRRHARRGRHQRRGRRLRCRPRLRRLRDPQPWWLCPRGPERLPTAHERSRRHAPPRPRRLAAARHGPRPCARPAALHAAPPRGCDPERRRDRYPTRRPATHRGPCQRCRLEGSRDREPHDADAHRAASSLCASPPGSSGHGPSGRRRSDGAPPG